MGLSVEPIITEEMFDGAAARRNNNPHPLRGRPSHTYKLKGLVWCGICGKRFCGQPNHGRPRYGCANRDRLTGAMLCDTRSVMAEPLERTVLKAVEDVVADERTLEALVSKHRSELAAGVNAAELEPSRHAWNRCAGAKKRPALRH